MHNPVEELLRGEVDTAKECQCPPYPRFPPGSPGAGAEVEARAKAAWERYHGHHANAEKVRRAGATG